MREKKKSRKNRRESIFYRFAMALYKKSCIRKLPFFSGRQVEADLIRLCPDENPEWIKTEYYVRKLALFLMIIMLGTLFAAAAKINEEMNAVLREGGILQRGSPGEEGTQVTVRAEYGEETYDFQIQLAARQMREEEAGEWMSELMKALPRVILGENESLENVVSDLILRERYGECPVTVQWESSRPDILDESGRIQPVGERADITLKAVLACGEYIQERTLEVTILPEILSEEEKQYRELKEYLVNFEKETREEENLQLPKIWNGKAIDWNQKKEHKALLLWTGSLFAAILVYCFSDRDLHARLEKRRKALAEEYPDVVHELVLLMGAGMTMRGAFRKMADDYEEKKYTDKRYLPAYEDILYMCREMQSGVSEGVAYEQFGRRTGVQQYIRLSGLLMQNLKRGNAALPERLREEAYRAGEEKLQQCRKRGEEAGTKLLMPMVMMLAVVMLLIMIPAFHGI